jgi:hypothetical protein
MLNFKIDKKVPTIVKNLRMKKEWVEILTKLAKKYSKQSKTKVTNSDLIRRAIYDTYINI